MQTSINNYFTKNKKNFTLQKKVEEKTFYNYKSYSENEDILRKFDLNPKYGPCKGITRSRRYGLAIKYNLNPPNEIEILIKECMSEKCFYDRFI
jgi:hypothetical protein